MGFDHNVHLLALLLDILKAWDTKNTYSKTDDDNVYVEFKNKSDINNACLYTYYNYNMKITGLSREILWSNRQDFLKDNNRRLLPLKTDIYERINPSSSHSMRNIGVEAKQVHQIKATKMRRYNSKDKYVSCNKRDDGNSLQSVSLSFATSSNKIPIDQKNKGSPEVLIA